MHRANQYQSRQNHRRDHRHRPLSQTSSRGGRRKSSSSTSSSSSRSSSSSSSSSRSSTSSSSSSTSRSSSSSSSTSRSSYSSDHSPKRKVTRQTRDHPSKTRFDDNEIHRPSLDERIAALFQQQHTTTSSSISSKNHSKTQPSPNTPTATTFSYSVPPPAMTPSTNLIGSHHHHQQSYGIVNNFNFFGNSFPPASFLNSAGGTNWQDMFKQPPPSASTTNLTTNYSDSTSNNSLQPYISDSQQDRERKTNGLTSAVSEIVTRELAEILRKDLAKKLIETLVFKSIETWYDIEERKDKLRRIKSVDHSSQEHQNSLPQDNLPSYHHSISHPILERTNDESSTPQTPIVPSSSGSSTNISTYFEHLRDNTAISSVRSQIPKIPTFKVNQSTIDSLVIESMICYNINRLFTVETGRTGRETITNSRKEYQTNRKERTIEVSGTATTVISKT